MKCGQCHMNPVGGDMPVYTYTSAEGFGCAGCHGQNYGETIPTGLGLPNEGAPKASAYGLRKGLDDLFAAMIHRRPAPCGACHFPGSPITGDPSPAPAIFPETVAAAVLRPSRVEQPERSLQTRRRRAGTAAPPRLDNDGNGVANYEADSACQAFVDDDHDDHTTTSTHHHDHDPRHRQADHRVPRPVDPGRRRCDRAWRHGLHHAGHVPGDARQPERRHRQQERNPADRPQQAQAGVEGDPAGLGRAERTAPSSSGTGSSSRGLPAQSTASR